MAYRLPDEGRATALRAARVMFPHDGLPDEAYDKVVAKLEADASGDSGIAATLEQGVAGLDAQQRFVELDADAQLQTPGRERGLRRSSSCSRPPPSSSSTTTRSSGRPSATRARRRISAATSTAASTTSTGCPTRPSPSIPTAGSHHR